MQQQTGNCQTLPTTQNSMQQQNQYKSFDQVFQFIWESLKQVYQQNKNLQNYNETQKRWIKQSIQKNHINNGLGSMFGAFMGDALGSYLQFKQVISKQMLQEAIQMPGGGTFPFLLPGQFTDDSQMATHMLKGLLSFNPHIKFQDQKHQMILKIAQQYNHWYNSNPFDIGITTRIALAEIDYFCQKNKNQTNVKKKFEDLTWQTFAEIHKKNQKSQSNGSLMRITPMAFFLSNLMQQHNNEHFKNIKDYEGFIRSEINMTHGNKYIFQSSIFWVHLLTHLITRKQSSILQAHKKFEQQYKNCEEKQFQGVQQWINYSINQKPMDAGPSMGWAKIAFTHGLIQLRKLTKFMEQKNNNLSSNQLAQRFRAIMKHVIGLGGDTDTNGAIIGGLIGAVIGFKNLPLNYLKKQFQLRLYKNCQAYTQRGQMYEPRRVFYNAVQLLSKFNRHNQSSI